MGNATLTSDANRGKGLWTLSGACLFGVWLTQECFLLSGEYKFSVASVVFLAAFGAFALVRASFHVRAIFIAAIFLSLLCLLAIQSPDPILIGLHRAEVFGAFIPAVIFLRASLQPFARIQPTIAKVAESDNKDILLKGLTGNFLVGSLLNVGSLHMLVAQLRSEASNIEMARLAQASAIGVACAVMWSPFFVSVGFVSQMLGQVPLVQLLAMCLCLACLMLATFQVYLTGKLDIKGLVYAGRSFGNLLLPLMLVTVGVIFCSHLFGFSGAQSVVVVAPLVACSLLLINRPTAILGACRDTVRGVSRTTDELLVVIGAMVLGSSIDALPYLRELFQHVTPGAISADLLIPVIVLSLVLLGQLGAHPMIGIGILVPILSSRDFGLDPLVIGMMCVFAWGISATVSIWTLPISASSAVFSIPVTRLISKRLLFWVFSSALGVSLVLGVLNRVLLSI